jgi:uncharacterized protein YaiI (UPF0178 family)
MRQKMLRIVRFVFIFLVMMCTSDIALAQEVTAAITQITALEDGNWSQVKQTSEAIRIRRGHRMPVAIDMTLELGDEVVVERAVIELTMVSGEVVTLSRGAKFVVGGEAGRAAAAIDAGIPSYNAQRDRVVTRDVSVAHRIGRVVALVAKDPFGRVTMVAKTDTAMRSRSGKYEPITQGMEIWSGDVVETDDATLEVLLDDGNRLSISKLASVIFTDSAVYQQKGEVYYQMPTPREILVQGISIKPNDGEFFVTGFDPVIITATRGEMTVTSQSGGEVLSQQVVRGGQKVEAVQGGPVRPATRWNIFQRPGTLSHAYATSGAMKERGLHLIAGGTEDMMGGGMRYSARTLIYHHIAWTRDIGLLASADGAQVPFGAGLEMTFGLFDLGGGVATMLDYLTNDCGGKATLRAGGQGHMRFTLPWTRARRLELEARVIVTDTVSGSLGVGIGWPL